MTHFGLYLTVTRLIMIGEWRKLVHPLILTLWFWFSYFQIDIVTQYTFSPLYDHIMGCCRTNYGLARGAKAENILHYRHKQLWVKKLGLTRRLYKITFWASATRLVSARNWNKTKTNLITCHWQRCGIMYIKTLIGCTGTSVWNLQICVHQIAMKRTVIINIPSSLPLVARAQILT